MADNDASPPPPRQIRPRLSAASPPVFSPLNPFPDPDNQDGRLGMAEGRSREREGPVRPRSAERDSPQPRRSHKHRSTGGFLLSTSMLGGGGLDSAAGARTGATREEKQSVSDRQAKQRLSRTRQQPPILDPRNRGYGYSDTGPSGTNSDVFRRGASDSHEDNIGIEQVAPVQDVVRRPSLFGSNQPLAFDADSAQIVNMALNLSESRRIAARRNMSSPLPPRLAPVPDYPQTGSLKQHLQQQRRSSRTASPGHLVVPGQRMPSLPVTVETEPSYQYYFSPSTLARAQKAKEHLELMAQYRRLLEIIPPLDPLNLSRQTTLSPPTSSGNGFSPRPLSGDPIQNSARAYNPLQFIRNRKVRQRERHTISGESCGFSDVNKVSDWVDDVAKLAATHPGYPSTTASLVPFPDAEPTEEDGTEAGSSKPTVAAIKPRRPRIDWVTDPADMIADVYWLEQNDHKKLIEDRHWRRMFPQDSDLYPARPVSLLDDGQGSIPDPATTESEGPSSLRPPDIKPVTKPKTSLDTAPEQPQAPLYSARERARNKLHDLKGKHHRHSSSIPGTDFLRLRRGSFEDSSDSDSDARRRRARKGTISAQGKDVLEKQMMELVAKEAREREFDVQDVEKPVSHIKSPKPPPASYEGEIKKTKLGGQSHNRKESKLADISDVEEKGPRFRSKTSSPLVSARQSLEVPDHLFVDSIELDNSLPNSPNLRPSRRGSGLIPPIGLDFSPATSRPTSPSRNPFSKVKQKIFRERSRERSWESKSEEHNAPEECPDAGDKQRDEMYRISLDGRRSHDRIRPSSTSPARKLAAKATGDGQKGHSRMASLRTRDEVGGPRGIFKNPRIDAIIRGSVSKVGDLIWRKGQYNQDFDSDTSTDDSDTEEVRGRRLRDPYSHGSPNGNGNIKMPTDANSPSPKHFLDSMPPFIAAHPRGAIGQSDLDHEQTEISPPNSPSKRRFDRLKPPRIDVQTASSPTPSPPSFILPKSKDSDRSTTGSRSRPASYIEGVGGARRSSGAAQLNSILGMPPPSGRPGPSFAAILPTKPDRPSMAMAMQSRSWSISGTAEGIPTTTTATATATTAAGGGMANFISRKEVARARTRMLSTGIKALEICRRAGEPVGSLEQMGGGHGHGYPLGGLLTLGQNAGWGEIVRLAEEGNKKASSSSSLSLSRTTNIADSRGRNREPVTMGMEMEVTTQSQIFLLASETLSTSISKHTKKFHASASRFVQRTGPELEQRMGKVRERVNEDLSTLVRSASDDADGLAGELVVGQRMKMKRVNEVIDKMLRRRRRRFRWVRRAGWLAVEWGLVGFMWYVWLMVVLVRVVLGTTRSVGRGVRWLFWL